jgi:hypothetical protein
MRFSAPVQTGPNAQSTSSAMGTPSFLELNKLGLGVSHPLPSSAKFKEQVSYSSTPILCFQGKANFAFAVTNTFIFDFKKNMSVV